MIPNRREVLKAIGGLAAAGSPLAWLLRFWRPRPVIARSPFCCRFGSGDKLGRALRRASSRLEAARAPRHHPDMFRLIGNCCPGFWLRVVYRRRSERWEIYADADRKRLLAAETFEAPALPRLSATHGGFGVTAAKSPDGWLETQVTRRRGLQEELLGARIR